VQDAAGRAADGAASDEELRMNRTHAWVPVVLLTGAALLVAGCGDDDATDDTASTSEQGAPTTTGDAGSTSSVAAEPVVDPGDGGDYDPQIDPANFVATIDNPYLPLAPGSVWEYEGTSEDGTERVVVEVTDETREVMGVTATVVRDRVYVGDELVEDTDDWFAQDADGNVWYFGEEVENFEDGQLEDTDGSWEAGVDGALPGIVMPADPQVGDAFRQEFYEGEAEDMFEILAVDGERSVPAGDFSDALVTEDWNPLEPDVVEQKTYAPGVGLIYEEKTVGGEEFVELIEYTIP
jgi:hypothetical protein